MKFNTITTAALLSGSLLCAESALPTDNNRPNWTSCCFPEDQKRIETGATLE